MKPSIDSVVGKFGKMAIHSALISALLISSAPLSVSAKNITRSCDGFYHIKNVRKGIEPVGISPVLTGFSARRGCGSAVPNRCRQRARDALHTCMQTHWNDRNKQGRPKPANCSSDGVRDYWVEDLKGELEEKVCRLVDAPATENNTPVVYTFDVHRTTKGDKTCGKSAKLVSAYRVKCCGTRINQAGKRELNKPAVGGKCVLN